MMIKNIISSMGDDMIFQARSFVLSLVESLFIFSKLDIGSFPFNFQWNARRRRRPGSSSTSMPDDSDLMSMSMIDELVDLDIIQLRRQQNLIRLKH